jgi:hypothetical protein
MPEVLLINEMYIKKYTQVNGSVDPNLLYPSIYLAQDKYLMPYLGTNLYNKIKDDILNDDLSGLYLELVDDYARRVVLWFTMLEVMPNLSYKVDNGTLVQRQSEDTVAVTDAVMKDILLRAQSNATFYLSGMVDWLCANSGSIPEYGNNVWPQRAPLSLKKSSFNYIFSTGNTATSRTAPYNRLSQIP